MARRGSSDVDNPNTAMAFYEPGSEPTVSPKRTYKTSIGERLEKLSVETAELKAQQAEERRRAKAAQQAQTDSKEAFDQWVAAELDRRIFLGGVTQALAAEYIAVQANPLNALMELYLKAFSSPVYGLTVRDGAFYFAGDRCDNILKVQQKLSSLFGHVRELDNGFFTEALIEAVLREEANPINYALTHTNPYPENLVGTEAHKLHQLTAYHHQLGVLTDAQQRPVGQVAE